MDMAQCGECLGILHAAWQDAACWVEVIYTGIEISYIVLHPGSEWPLGHNSPLVALLRFTTSFRECLDTPSASA